MVDLTTFGDNVGSERFESTMQSTRIAREKKFVLSNQGPPGDKIADWPNKELYYNGGENVNSDLQETRGTIFPAITYRGDWFSNSAQVLVNYQMGETSWADKEPPVEVSLVWESPLQLVTTTSLTETISTDVQEGDMLIASVFDREGLAIPTGWSLLISDSVSGSGFSQTSSILYKEATSADIGNPVIFDQGTSNRMGLHVSAFRNPSGISLVSASSATGYVSGGVFSTVTDNVTKDGSIVFSSGSAIFAAVDAPNDLTADAPWIQMTPDSSNDTANQLRLGTAYLPADAGESASCQWSQNITNTGDTTITIQFIMEGAA